jgi:single-strand DNA-binding protein
MLNKVMMIGRLSKDPDMKYTQNGDAVANFSIAINKGNDKPAEFYDIVAWKQLAEVCAQYLKKGKLVYVEGELNINKYEKDGVTHKNVRIVIHNMRMLSPKEDATQQVPYTMPAAPQQQPQRQQQRPAQQQRPVQQSAPQYNQPFVDDPTLDDCPF